MLVFECVRGKGDDIHGGDDHDEDDGDGDDDGDEDDADEEVVVFVGSKWQYRTQECLEECL